jgi:hypothetical protein
VIIDGSLSDETIHEMIEDSYGLVVSKLPHARSPRSQPARKRPATSSHKDAARAGRVVFALSRSFGCVQ